jgi:arabinogalactan oligomer/maltooligosaccharide transport system permease protein
MLLPIIWVILASITEKTQSPFMIERIFSPEHIHSEINGNQLKLKYKLKSLTEIQTFTFGRDLAGKYITLEYFYITPEGDFIENVSYTVSDQPTDLKNYERDWVAYFQLDDNANIIRQSYVVNRKMLLNFFNVLTFASYRDILWDANFRIWLANSFIISILTALVSILLGFFSGYAFSRYQFPGRKVSLMWVLATQLFPLAMMLVPFYLLAAKVFPSMIPGLQITNTRWGLILVYSATALPFSIWMLKGYFDTIPIDLEEAAIIDGANLPQMLFYILLPVTRPAMFTAFLFAFVQSWNEYAVASMFMTDPDRVTLPVGLQSLMGGSGSYNQEISLFAAAAVVVSIPIVVLFLSMKRELVEGATLGAVKG